MKVQLLLVASLTAGVLLIPQRRVEWVLVFAWLSYFPLALATQAFDVHLLAAFGYLVNATFLLLTLSSKLGWDLRSLQGAVSTYPIEGWLLVLNVIALAALPPFANFTWFEKMASEVVNVEWCPLLLTAVRVVWLFAFTRLAVEFISVSPGGVGRMRTKLWPIALTLFVILTLVSLLLLVWELGGRP